MHVLSESAEAALVHSIRRFEDFRSEGLLHPYNDDFQGNISTGLRTNIVKIVAPKVRCSTAAIHSSPTAISKLTAITALTTLISFRRDCAALCDEVFVRHPFDAHVAAIMPSIACKRLDYPFSSLSFVGNKELTWTKVATRDLVNVLSAEFPAQ